MRKTLPVFIVLVCIALLFPLKVFAEQIDRYDTNIVVNKDGTVDITETLTWDFGGDERHGMIRKIITTKENEDGDTFRMKFDNFAVTDANNNPVTFSTQKNSNSISLKIGDANRLVTGIQTYKISYRVYGAISYFTDHDEFYWNVTGNENTVTIEDTNTLVYLPDETVEGSGIKVDCFTGPKGGEAKFCETMLSGNKVLVDTKAKLYPGEGVTVVAGFPTGIVTRMEPEKVEVSLLAKVMRIIFTAVLSLAWLTWFIFLPLKVLITWVKERLKVKKFQRIVSAWFESPETLSKRSLTPAETGALVNTTIDHKHISATLIDLAQRGFIKIRIDDKKNVYLDKVKEYKKEQGVLEFEEEILDGIFSSEEKDSVKMKSLSASTKFYDATVSFKKDLSTRLRKEKLLIDDIHGTESFYIFLSIVSFVTLNLMLALISLIIGRKLVRKTEVGIEKYSEGVSLKNFLVSQTEQINFQADNQMFFEKLLPYATAFGVEKVWAKRFEDLQLAKPEWLEGDVSNTAALTLMTRSLNSGITSNALHMSATRSSSGFSSGFSGGHSGGGGGGGGSSSW